MNRPYSPTTSSCSQYQGTCWSNQAIAQGLRCSSKSRPFQEIDDRAGAETADELVEAEIEHQQQQRHAGPGVHGPARQPFGEGRPDPCPLRNHPVEQPLADPLALQADTQMQIDAPLENHALTVSCNSGGMLSFAGPHQLLQLFVPLQQQQGQSCGASSR